MINKIVSGGQTGVDQAALEVAEEYKISYGGWCPKGGFDETGKSILPRFFLKETDTEDPNERTVLNIRDSEATLIIVPLWPLPDSIKDGTLLTIKEVKRQNKPYFIANLSEAETSFLNFYCWISDNKITHLNIAGPRESNSPGIHDAAKQFLSSYFSIITMKPKL